KRPHRSRQHPQAVREARLAGDRCIAPLDRGNRRGSAQSAERARRDMTLVLASASTSRARMLKDAGVPFAIKPAHVDEDAVRDSLLAEGVEPGGVADALAELKAVRISAGAGDALVLGADQVLNFDGELISKMPDLAATKGLLKRLAGKRHELVSAAVLARGGAAIWRHSGRVRLTMRPLSDAFLDDYLAQEGEDLLKGVG